MRYDIVSDDLGYNTGNKLVTFYSPSVVTSDSGKNKLKTSDGTYDSQTGTAHFVGHSYIYNEQHYLEGDTVFYNKVTGYGFANGHVITLDTGRHSKLYCEHLEYFKIQRIMWATGKPVLEQVNGKDTLYIRADTFYSFPAPKPGEVVKKQPPKFGIAVDSMDMPMDSVALKTNKARSIDTTTKTTDSLGTAITNKQISKQHTDTSTKTNVSFSELVYINTLSLSQTVLNASAKDTPVAKQVVALPKYINKNGYPPLAVEDSFQAYFNLISMLATPIDKMVHRKGEVLVLANTYTTSISPKKTKQGKGTNKKGGKTKDSDGEETTSGVAKTDSTKADTTAPLIFIGYHHVRIFSDSLQGTCDSISYSQSDSTIRMMFDPIAWSHMSQITGDTILLKLDDSGKLKSLFVPNNSFVVSQSGPEKAQLFDQVQGKTLTGYFINNTINKLVVVPEAQSIYYSKDSKGAYVGESEASSERMKIYFQNQQINKILFEKDVTQTMTPLEKVNIPEARLGRFKWLMDQRPKSKKELFD